VADAVPVGHDDVLVDDAAVQSGSDADADAGEQDAVGDVGVVGHIAARSDDRSLDVSARHDRALAQQAAVDVGRLPRRAP
jgi:hypothetical protein